MDLVLKGKRIVISLIVFVLVSDVIVIAINSSLYAVNGMFGQATFKIAQGLFRLFLEGVILFFLYAGHGWAKWLLSILLLLGGALSLLSVLLTYSFFSLFIGIIYLTFGIVLLKSESIKCFLENQRNGKR